MNEDHCIVRTLKKLVAGVRGDSELFLAVEKWGLRLD